MIYKEYQQLFHNGLDIVNQSCVDHSMKSFESTSHTDVFQNSGVYKKLIWKEHIPTCLNKKNGKNIQFYGLHLQGDAKYLIFKFYQEKKTILHSLKLKKYFWWGCFETTINRVRKQLPFKVKLGWLKKIVGG